MANRGYRIMEYENLKPGSILKEYEHCYFQNNNNNESSWEICYYIILEVFHGTQDDMDTVHLYSLNDKKITPWCTDSYKLFILNKDKVYSDQYFRLEIVS